MSIRQYATILRHLGHDSHIGVNRRFVITAVSFAHVSDLSFARLPARQNILAK